MMYGKVYLMAAVLVLATCPVSAAPWVMDKAQSHLTFEGKQGTSAFQGSFSKFDVKIDFDMEHPEKGSISATIDTGSASAGSKERDDYLPQAEWFNSAKFPSATFISTSIQHAVADTDGAKCYHADGTLTIKGVSKPLILPFCLSKEGDHYRAKGKVPLVRTDYQIGEGAWKTEDYVKFAVDIDVDLVVRPQ